MLCCIVLFLFAAELSEMIGKLYDTDDNDDEDVAKIDLATEISVLS